MGPMGCGETNAQNEVLKIKGDPVHSKSIFIFYASCASKKSRGADLSILKRDFESVPCVLTKLLIYYYLKKNIIIIILIN